MEHPKGEVRKSRKLNKWGCIESEEQVKVQGEKDSNRSWPKSSPPWEKAASPWPKTRASTQRCRYQQAPAVRGGCVRGECTEGTEEHGAQCCGCRSRQTGCRRKTSQGSFPNHSGARQSLGQVGQDDVLHLTLHVKGLAFRDALLLDSTRSHVASGGVSI